MNFSFINYTGVLNQISFHTRGFVAELQIIKTFLLFVLFITPVLTKGQSTLFQQGSKEYILLERLEIKMQRDSNLNFSAFKPYNRQWWASSLEKAASIADELNLSEIDRYNLDRAKLNNLEWTSKGQMSTRSKYPLWKTFYKDPANFVLVNQSDFFLSVNPVLQLQGMRDNSSEQTHYLNSRGLAIRSQIGNRIGFQAYLTENLERPPVFARQEFNAYRAVPGAGLYKLYRETGYDSWDARGSIYVKPTKYLDVQLGHDKIFIGNGYRSLFISDQSASHAYLNLNLRAWKFNYSSRVMELQPQYTRRGLGGDTLLWKKYATIHYLSFNAPKWLTIGLFEGVVYGRQNRFEVNYLNPVIFLRAAELNVGSPDNSFIGFDLKANLAKRVQVYGQVMLDEFYTKFIRERKGWWANKWAFQAGLKYIDVLGVKNLDLQLETNWIRPFTYSHFDTVANYTHYNQPLAHPLHSNVKEYIAIAKYQPAPKWYMQLTSIYWRKGVDVNGVNYGNNIFKDSDTRLTQEGFFFFTPQVKNSYNINYWLAFEPMENLFLEANFSARKSGVEAVNYFGTIGIRLNMQRRVYDY
jgi:hypothetical protein